MELGLSDSSRKQYNKYWKDFVAFYFDRFDLPISQSKAKHVQLFITYLHTYKIQSVSSLRCYLSGIAFYSKMYYDRDITKSFGLSLLLKSYSKNKKAELIRKPIDNILLEKLIKHVQLSSLSQYDKLCYTLIYSLMYHACLRICEICHSNSIKHIIQFDNVTYSKSECILKLKLMSYKHSQGATPTIVINCSTFHNDVERYLKKRGCNPGYFICHENHKPFTRTELVGTLKKHLMLLKYNPDEYNSHSFRIGKATDLYHQGASDSQISAIGRWCSGAFRKYIRPNFIYS